MHTWMPIAATAAIVLTTFLGLRLMDWLFSRSQWYTACDVTMKGLQCAYSELKRMQCDDKDLMQGMLVNMALLDSILNNRKDVVIRRTKGD